MKSNLININIKLNKKTLNLLLSLEKYTGITKESFLNNLVNGKIELDELQALNRVLKRREKNPQPKIYNQEEAHKFLGF